MGSVLNGNVGVVPPRQIQAYSGNYYVATNPTPGTGVQSGLVTAFSATVAGHCVVVNNNAVGSGINLYLDYIKFILSGTAPATTTAMHLAGFTDVAASCVPSAGSVLYTPVNVNPDSSAVSNAAVYVPTGGVVLTIPAASGARKLISRAVIPTSLGITGDTYILQFGAAADIGSQGGGTAIRATAAATLGAETVPVILPPGKGFILDMWWLTETTTAPTFEWEVALLAF